MNIPRVAGNIGLAVQMVFDRLISWLQRWLTLNVDAVANLAALAALDASSISNGNAKRVLTLRANFVLDKSSALVPDGITVVAAVGGGNWIRTAPDQPDEVWQRQTTWYIDAVAGNDENVGSTVPTAIKTWAEYARRTGIASGAQLPPIAVVVNVLTDLPVDDPVNTSCSIELPGSVRVTGALTVLEGPYVVGAYAFSPSTNVPASITSTWDPATLLDKMILFTSGVASGAVAWVFKDGGGGIGLTTRPSVADTVADVTPAPGDTFVVVDRPSIRATFLHSRSVTGGAPVSATLVASGLTFQDLSFESAADAMTIIGGGVLERCNIFVNTLQVYDLSQGRLSACRLDAGSVQFSESWCWVTNMLSRRGQMGVFNSTLALLTGIMTGAGTILARYSQIAISTASLGIFDTTGSPIIDVMNGHVAGANASAVVYGTGNVSTILRLQQDSFAVTSAAWPATTVSATPYTLGAEFYTFAELPRIDLKRNTGFFISGTVPAQVFSFNVADPTALGLVPTTAVPNGTYAFVVSVREPFVLNTASVAVADGINVVTAQDGGRWIRLGSNPIPVGVKGNLTAGATRFALQDLTESAAEFPIIATRAGNLRNLQCRVGTAPSGAESVQVTLFVNGVQTTAPIRATITGANVTAVDTTHLQAVAIGDRISAQVINSNLGGFAAANLQVSFEIA